MSSEWLDSISVSLTKREIDFIRDMIYTDIELNEGGMPQYMCEYFPAMNVDEMDDDEREEYLKDTNYDGEQLQQSLLKKLGGVDG